MRSDPGIFNFVKWLRVGEEARPALEQAKARLKELYPSKPGWPDTTLVISHSKRMAVNAAANRALAPEASKLLELEVIHIDLGETQNGCDKCITQSMRVWPGLRLIGRRKDTQGRLCDLRQLPGAHPVRLDLVATSPHAPQAPSCWRRPRTGSTAPPGAPA